MSSVVYVEKTERRADFTAAVLERFTRDILLRNPRTVLVKPDIVSHEAYPTTTHLDVLDAVLVFLKRFHVHITVGDGPATDAGDSQQLMLNHHLQAICSSHNLKLVNLHSHPFTKAKTERGFSLTLSATALDCDYIISLPVLKPHGRCGMAGALNNQYGLFPSRDRLLMRSRLLKDIHRSIAEVNTVARPNIIVMDAVKTYSGAHELRHGAVPADLGYMLASGDPVAVDCHGLKLLGEVEPSLANRKPEDIEHLNWAKRIGVGSMEYHVRRAFLR